ncbi:hypothetical protein LOTGIDRAFT_148335, partial [Lottia gigantea]
YYKSCWPHDNLVMESWAHTRFYLRFDLETKISNQDRSCARTFRCNKSQNGTKRINQHF